MEHVKINEECVEGVVAEVIRDSFKVSMITDDGCKSCGMNNLCNQKIITLNRQDGPADLKAGQRIKFEYDKVIQTSFLLYIIPILFFIAGILITKNLFHISNEPVQFLSAFAATGIAFIIIHFIDNRASKNKYHINIKVIN